MSSQPSCIHEHCTRTKMAYKTTCKECATSNLGRPKPDKESLESIQEAEEILAKGSPGYSSAEEMFKAMGV